MNIQAILAALAFVIKWLGRGSFKTLISAWLLMKRFNLHMLLFFFIFVVPELLGSYAFLESQGIAWYFSAVGAVGVEAGGSAFTALNNVYAILNGTTVYSVPILIFGAISAMTTLFWYIYIYTRTLNMITGMTPFAKMVIGATIFALMIMITLLIDQYMLTGDSLRVSGMTYFLENPDQSLSPIRELFGVQQPSDYINQTVNGTGNTG